MFGKKKEIPQVDQEQLAFFKHAQKRIKQKKRLYSHFILFLIGAILLIVANLVLKIGENFKILGIDWFVFAVVLWFVLFLYHFINVFVTNKFLGESWEKSQLERLVSQQQERIETIKAKLYDEELAIAKKEIQEETEKNRKSEKRSNLTIIAAAGEDHALGKDNDLIWHLSDDLKRFKNLTNGHHIIMGRKTFESFPKPLPNRTHIVITRQQNYTVPSGVIVVHNLKDALDASKNDTQPFIIGGGEIYRQAMPLADKIELTRVHGTFEDADTHFPEINESQWQETARSYHNKDANHPYDFSFITYVKK